MRSTSGMANRVTRLIAQLLFRAWPTVVASGYPEASYLNQIYQKPCQETPFSFRRRRESSVWPGLPLRAAEPRNWRGGGGGGASFPKNTTTQWRGGWAKCWG